MKMIRVCMLLVMLLPLLATAREVPVVDFFRHAEFTEVELSPAGDYLAISVPQNDRTLLAILRVKDKGIVSKWDFGAKKHVIGIDWVNNDRFLVRVAEKQGSLDALVMNPDLFAANADGSRRLLLALGGTYNLVDLLRSDSDNLLVQRTIERPNLFKLNVNTGRMSKVAVSPIESGNFAIDNEGKVRYAMGVTKDGKTIETYRREPDGNWKLVLSSDFGSAERKIRLPLGFTKDNKSIYMGFSQAGEPHGVMLTDPETGKETVLFQHAGVDVSDYIWSHDATEMLGVGYHPGLPHKKYFAGGSKETEVLAALDVAFPDHTVDITSRTWDGRYVLASVYSDTDPGSAYLFDTQNNKATFLLSNRSWIKSDEMSEMRPVSVKTRDGLTLHGFLTIPKGSNGKNLPMIVNPHGGPHGPRDYWEFNPEVQFLANRGYAVLQMNYRGSGGYGQKFEAAGYQNWGGAMQDDLTDSVKWVVGQGIADPDRICTYGGSYGGYAALMSVVREPELYQCSVGYVGVYSLPLMHKTGDIPKRESGRNYLVRVLGSSQADMQKNSPAYNVEKIKVPVMLVHGRRDERVPIAQMDFLIQQMSKAGKVPEKVIVEDKEGHGFYDVANNVNLYTQMQEFFDRHIGDSARSASGSR